MQRFITAQEDIYLGVVEELKNAHKSSHWIWYIFPQLIGLGRSEYSHFYGIKNIDEAIAYTNNPLLWDRYIECCKILLDIKGHTIYEIMGFIDAVKIQDAILQLNIFAYFWLMLIYLRQ